MISGIDHIGIAVESLDDAVALWSTLLGREPDEVEEVADQKVRVAVFRLGSSRIELLQPTDDDSPVANALARRGPGIHHLALATDDTAGELRRLNGQRVQLIDESPRAGAGGARIAFVHPRAAGGVLTELCQR